MIQLKVHIYYLDSHPRISLPHANFLSQINDGKETQSYISGSPNESYTSTTLIQPQTQARLNHTPWALCSSQSCIFNKI